VNAITDRAPTREAFLAVIARYNQHNDIRGGLQGDYSEHGLGEVAMSHVTAAIGLIWPGMGGVKQLCDRTLIWHVPTLITARGGEAYIVHFHNSTNSLS
jgi:hypothetical protein